ncbi:hypothetical protein [Massilia consociata]|uniref:Uncharacterized protein n=1 Tax=Massilia consociata TaxID=760117 RepID=A0ABV6FKI6_9BURK
MQENDLIDLRQVRRNDLLLGSSCYNKVEPGDAMQPEPTVYIWAANHFLVSKYPELIAMDDKHAMLESSVRNSGFSTLLCSTLGFVLLEGWAIRNNAKPFTHAVIVALGSILAAIIYRVLLSPEATARTRMAVFSHSSRGSWNHFNPASIVLLLTFGYAGAAALSSGSFLLVAAFTACASLFPWSRIPLCRTCILSPLALMTIATFLGILLTDQVPHLIYFLVAVWMLWIAAACSWLQSILRRRRRPESSVPVDQRGAEAPVSALRD